MRSEPRPPGTSRAPPFPPTSVPLARALRCGSVAVNAYSDDAHDMTVPFGGYKQSGFGRDKSLHALDKYTQLKTTWVNLK